MSSRNIIVMRKCRSVDPFGHGLMVPYLLTLSGIRHMVIGRVNTNIKDSMKQNHQLHFRWGQTWDLESRWAPFVNVLPNLYYTVINACGTDESICCQFDVAESARTLCTERAQVDSPHQIAKYAERMASQYRSLQPFYDSDTVLVAAGDDFSYSTPEDLEIVHRVYTSLFTFINNNSKRFNMHVQFGTVADYFDALKNVEEAPILDGDFFPYMDVASSRTPYWTGYYNHRAYFKRFERIVQGKLRSLDLMSVSARKQLSDQLESARRNLALCQHHDAITGTSTREVMGDYMLRLRSALLTVLVEQQNLLDAGSANGSFGTVFVEGDIVQTSGMFLPRKALLFSGGIKKYGIQFFNQKPFRAEELITVNTSSAHITVRQNGEAIDAQAVPLLGSSNLYELSFFVPLEPFSTAVISIHLEENQTETTVLTPSIDLSGKMAKSQAANSDGKITLKNQFFTLYWSIRKNGNHQIVYKDGNVETNFDLRFSRISDDGGSYTMVARGSPKEYVSHSHSPTRMVEGPLYSTLWQRLAPELAYSITVINSSDEMARALQVDIYTNVLTMPGQTLLMNLRTGIRSNDLFYTDVNGMYLIQRSYNKSQRFEANIYPMSTEAMIEDNQLRCTILGAQPTGATARNGELTLMIDREMIADDGKGLQYQEAGESYPSHLEYRIIFESKAVSARSKSYNAEMEPVSETVEATEDFANSTEVLYHSQFVQQNLEQLLYPADLFISNSTTPAGEKAIVALPPLPDNIQLINARYIKPNAILLSMRKLPFDCSTRPALKCNTNSDLIRQFFASFQGSVYESNLTGTKTGSKILSQSIPKYLTQSLHIVTFLVKLDQSL